MHFKYKCTVMHTNILTIGVLCVLARFTTRGRYSAEKD